MRIVHFALVLIALSIPTVSGGMDCGDMQEKMISTIKPATLDGFLRQANEITKFEEQKLADVENIIREKVEAHQKWIAENLTPLATRMDELKAKATGDLRRDFDSKIAPVLERRVANQAATDRAVAMIERTRARLNSITAKTNVISLWFRSMFGMNTRESLKWQAARNLLRKYEGQKGTAVEQMRSVIAELEAGKANLAESERKALEELDTSLSNLRNEASTRQMQAFAERIAVEKDVAAKRDALAKEIEAYLEREVGVGRRLEAALKTIYEATCQSDRCTHQIQSARRAISSAQLTEAVDLFSNNKVVSAISTMSTSVASSEISEASSYLDRLSSHVREVRKVLDGLGKGQVGNAEFSGVVQVSDFLDVVVDMTWNPSFDFTSAIGIMELSRAGNALWRAAEEVENVRRELNGMRGKLQTSLDAYNQSMKSVATSIIREEIQRKN